MREYFCFFPKIKRIDACSAGKDFEKELTMDVNHVADFFIRQADIEAGDLMTHLKLQKLLYYAQGWSLALHGKPLFDDRIEAWAHGPVCPKVWNRFKARGWSPIELSETRPGGAITAKEKKLLDEVWNSYGQFTAKRLEEMTHDETPYKAARGNLPAHASCQKVISHASMRAFFSGLIPK